jgi:hypothetical protein
MWQSYPVAHLLSFLDYARLMRRAVNKISTHNPHTLVCVPFSFLSVLHRGIMAKLDPARMSDKRLLYSA